MRRAKGTTRTKWAAAAVAVAAVLTGTAGIAVAASKIQANDWLTDLSTATDVTDGARAHVVVAPLDGSTHVSLKLQGLDHLKVGQTYGAHIHTGPCVAGNGAAAGPHYRHVVAGPATPANEVWLDFTVRQGGVARSETVVPFRIRSGAAHSVVIHALPTSTAPPAEAGNAGARIACIPIDL
jgi:Cu/Zn superoxide dismutase